MGFKIPAVQKMAAEIVQSFYHTEGWESLDEGLFEFKKVQLGEQCPKVFDALKRAIKDAGILIDSLATKEYGLTRIVVKGDTLILSARDRVLFPASRISKHLN